MFCKFYDRIRGCCTHVGNTDIRSKVRSGKPRKLPKRCKRKFCPILDQIEVKK